MLNQLVLSILGTDRPGIIDDLSKSIRDCGGSISDSRMTVLGGEFAMIVLVSGNWDAIAKLEDTVPRLAQQLELNIQLKRTEIRSNATDLLPYTVDVVAIDHPGIVNDIADFFSKHGINIEDMYTGGYQAAHSGTPMFSLHMTVSIPSSSSIASLRNDFMDFCDQLNLDAVIEPAK